MLETLEKIERLTESMEDKEELKKKDIVVDAVLSNLEIIGECKKHS
jgi:uncharacterized protein with HEPN domain